jgi:hypothetical protein
MLRLELQRGNVDNGFNDRRFEVWCNKKPRPNKIWVVFRIPVLLFNLLPSYDFNILFSYSNPQI